MILNLFSTFATYIHDKKLRFDCQFHLQRLRFLKNNFRKLNPNDFPYMQRLDLALFFRRNYLTLYYL